MKIEISSRALVSDAPAKIKSAIRERLTMANPAFLDAQKQGRYLGHLEAELSFYEDRPYGLACPRGFTRDLLAIAKENRIAPEIIDQRRMLPEVDFHFYGKLRPYQQEAVHAGLSRDFGVIQAPTGSGKTVLSMAVIAARKQPALVVVHTRELLNQWRERTHQFLGLPMGEIGQIGDGRFRIGQRITVAVVNSLVKRLNEVKQHVGLIVVDECHRTPSKTFTDAVAGFDCRFMMGLTATPWRRDRLTPVIGFYLGRTVHRIDAGSLTRSGDLCRARVIFRETSFRTALDVSMEYSRALSELTQDQARNRQIAADVATTTRNGSSGVLVLSDRKAHCEALQTALKAFGVDAAVLTGSTPAKQRAGIVAGLCRGSIKICIATGQLVGEGFDCKGLTHLFLASPLKFSGRVIQYAGRVLRPASGKDSAMIVDYVDTLVGVLKAAAGSRRRTYEQQGFSVE